MLPGIGAFLALPAGFGVLGGVHRGFSPVAPGTDDAEPELSVNYEGGARWSGRGAQAEVVGFFNDYQNLTNVCSFSGGCREDLLDSQSNAGAVNVYGAEASARIDRGVGGGVRLSGGVSYTFTQSEFQEAFESADPLFGSVDPGEELPYLPEHQASFDLAASSDGWGINTVITFVDRMRETADEDNPILGQLFTDRQFIVDVGGQFALTDSSELYAKIDNLLNQQNIVARRPFGARPGRPFSAFLGFKYRWGDT
ncbi:MAG: TonB-dependent receptor [Myxococcota bacterium]